MSAKIQGIPHASAYAWRIPVHYFTVIAKIHPESPAAMDFGTSESLPYGQREALVCTAKAQTSLNCNGAFHLSPGL